ncbi:hypothetical protein ACFY1C_34275, partial [Streptomyces sp. NPDC001279]|uniref:hypothetical protein n=1 Tax=Streptomyces sp. NPDC001279 TaxID=3364556 RepID=UPI00368CF815
AARTKGHQAPELRYEGRLTRATDNAGWSALPLTIKNQTDEAVLVFRGGNCTREAEGAVAPGHSGVFEFGTSVYVP